MTFDTVFISDVHLGTDRCNTKKFLKFLKGLKTKKLVMVGDIIDIYCMEKYNTRWKREHTECVHALLDLCKKGTEVVYVLGNHEGAIRRYCTFAHKNFMMCDEYVHKDIFGNKYLCTHGDKHSEFSSGSWKQLMFNWGYEFITPLSIFLNRHFRFSLVHFLKNTMRCKGYINKYEYDLIIYCNEQKKNYNGIICGHIHHANIRRFNDLIYMCCGDFVDTCSAITEKNGIYCLEKY